MKPAYMQIFSRKSLLKHLNTFSPARHSEFRRFLQSPFHTKQKHFPKLHDRLKELQEYLFPSADCYVYFDWWVKILDNRELFDFIHDVPLEEWMMIRNHYLENGEEALTDGSLAIMIKSGIGHSQNPAIASRILDKYLLTLTEFLDSEDRLRYFMSRTKRKTDHLLRKFLPRNLFSHIFGRELPFSQNRLNNSLKKFTKALEDFLVHSELKSDELQKKRFLFRALAKGRDTDLKVQLLEKWHDQIQHFPESLDKLENQLHYQNARYELKDRRGNKPNAPFIPDFRNAAADFHRLIDLRLGINLLIRQEVFEEENNHEFITVLLEGATHDPDNLPLLHQIYAGILSLFNENSVANRRRFLDIWSIIKSQGNKIDVRELKAMLSYLQSYCILLHRKFTIKEALADQGELLKWGLLQGILFPAGETVQDDVYLNTYITLSIQKEFKFIEETLEPYAKSIAIDRFNDVHHLARAYFCFHQAKFRTAKQHLLRMNRRENQYAIRKYSLMIRIAYEFFLADHDDRAMESSISAYENFLTRNSYRIPASKKKEYSNLLWFIKKMLQKPVDRQAIQNLRQNLIRELGKRKTFAKGWIRAKINQL